MKINLILSKKRFIYWLKLPSNKVFDESSSYTGSLIEFLKQFVEPIRVDLTKVTYKTKSTKREYSIRLPEWSRKLSISAYYTMSTKVTAKELIDYFSKEQTKI